VKPSAFPSRNTDKGEVIMKGEQCPTFIKLVGETIRFSFAQHQQGRRVSSVQRSLSLLVKPSAFPSRNTNKGEGEQCPTFIKLVGETIRFSFAQHQQGRRRLLVKPSAFPSRNTNKGEFIKRVGEAIRFSFAHRQQGRTRLNNYQWLIKF
jgi:hypothetical protein